MGKMNKGLKTAAAAKGRKSKAVTNPSGKQTKKKGK